MMSFINNNLIPISDFDEKIKFFSLKTALINYYETTQVFEESFSHYLSKTPSGIFLADVRAGDYPIVYTSSIIAIHLFFEQTIFQILENIHPALARYESKKNSKIIQLLTLNLSTLPIKNKRIFISTATKRLEYLIDNDNSIPNEYKVPKHYHFLKKHFKTIKIISNLRNEIIHSGEKILNRYAYDLLFINKLLPLIRSLLNQETPNFYLERNVACGLNIIDELIANPLPIDYTIEANYESLVMNLKKISQLKELGRASFHNKLFMGEDNSLNYDKIEKGYNKEIRLKGNLLAKFKQESIQHHKIYTCPCCGAESLSTFSIFRELTSNKLLITEAECSLCTYHINHSLGNPSEFGIMKDPIFGYIS